MKLVKVFKIMFNTVFFLFFFSENHQHCVYVIPTFTKVDHILKIFSNIHSKMSSLFRRLNMFKIKLLKEALSVNCLLKIT